MSGFKDLSLSPSLRAHGYLTLGENAQEEVRGREGGRDSGREGGRERDGRRGRRGGKGKESINKGTCTYTCIN